MTTHATSHIDYLDLLFRNRNKAYGSYELRRLYPNRLKRATSVVILAAIVLSAGPWIASALSPTKDIRINPRPIETTLRRLPEPPKPETPEPPQPSSARPVASTQYTVPRIAEPDEVTEEDVLQPVDSIVGQISDRSGEGELPTGPQTLTPGEGNGELARVDPPKPARTTIPDVVDQQPEFPGDVREYLARKLNYPDQAREAGIEGRVVIRFVVDEKGEISQATVARGIGGGCDEEALRVVRSMPSWKPAKINGEAVKCYFSLPIKFTLEG